MHILHHHACSMLINSFCHFILCKLSSGHTIAMQQLPHYVWVTCGMMCHNMEEMVGIIKAILKYPCPASIIEEHDEDDGRSVSSLMDGLFVYMLLDFHDTPTMMLLKCVTFPRSASHAHWASFQLIYCQSHPVHHHCPAQNILHHINI